MAGGDIFVSHSIEITTETFFLKKENETNNPIQVLKMYFRNLVTFPLLPCFVLFGHQLVIHDNTTEGELAPREWMNSVRKKDDRISLVA